MLRPALTELAGLSVPGVQANYDVDVLPDHLRRVQLPALLVLPVNPETSSGTNLFPERGSAFESLAFSAGPRTVSLVITHLLLVAPVQSGHQRRRALTSLVDLMDAYFNALAPVMTLNGRLLEPARVRVDPGQFEYGGVAYEGCAFRHLWVLQP